MASIVKWEGIVVDPIGAILAVIVFKIAIAGDYATAQADALKAIGIMVVVGILGALVLAKGSRCSCGNTSSRISSSPSSCSES